MRKLTEIIVHCSATRPDWMAKNSLNDKVKEIRLWHMSKPKEWKDIGYHYLIDRNGDLAAGRPLSETGAHTQGRNTGTVGICLIGGHGSAATDEFSKNFTKEQDESLRLLIQRLRDQNPSITLVTGHNQYAAKACPGFSVPKWLKQTPQKPARPTSILEHLRRLLGRPL
jgi:hypothetical protein